MIPNRIGYEPMMSDVAIHYATMGLLILFLCLVAYGIWRAIG